MSNYKLIQIGYTTFGEGETAEAARENARQWLVSSTDADDVPVFHRKPTARDCVNGDLVIVPADVAAEMGDY